MKRILLIALAVCMTLAVAACSSDPTQTTETTTTAQTQGTVSIESDSDSSQVVVDDGENTIVIGGGEWPDDVPDKLPIFDKGTINGTVMTEMGQAISFEDVDQADFEQYIEDLKDAGWMQMTHVSDDGTEMYMGQIEGMVVTAQFDSGDMMIIWAEM